MKQRLGIAISLLGDPKFIVIDKPTVGLDPTEKLNLLISLNIFYDLFDPMAES